MKRWRVGFVGVKERGIAHYHAQAFLVDGRAELVACCDIRPEGVQAFAEQFQIPGRYTDFGRMLEEAALDVVVICTNETLHAAMTIQAAAHRPRAILCEKPMAMNLAEADAMLAACAQHGVLLVVGHQRRYKPQYARAKELLQEGAIGELQEIVAWGHPGTSLLVDGTHTVDLIRFYLDDEPAEWVMGQVDVTTRRQGWGHVLEDAALALIKFRSGVRAYLTLGGHATPTRESLGGPVPPQAYHRLFLRGSQGHIAVNGDAPVPGGPPLLQLARGGHVEAVEVDHTAWHHGVSPQRELLDALVDGHPHPLAGTSARATLEILLSVYESSRRRRLVVLPLTNRENPLEQILAEEDSGASARGRQGA